MPKNNIIPQMFDVRPVKETGDLDWEKINGMDRTLTLEIKEIENFEKKIASMRNMEKECALRKAKVFRLGEKFESEEIPLFGKSSFVPKISLKEYAPEGYIKKMWDAKEKSGIEKLERYGIRKEKSASPEAIGIPKHRDGYTEKYATKQGYIKNIRDAVEIPKKETLKKSTLRKTKPKRKKPRTSREDFRFSDLFFPAKFSFNFNPRKIAFSFATLSLVVALAVGSVAYGAKGIKIKGRVLGDSQEAYSSLNSAIRSIKIQDFESSGIEFEKSYQKFGEASKNLDEMGETIIEISRFFPFSSKLSSGKNLVEAGKHIAAAGQSLNKIMKTASSLQNPLDSDGNQEISFLEIFKSSEKEIRTVSQEMEQIEENLSRINIDDLPEDKREDFSAIKEKLPPINETVKDFLGNSEIFVDLLGGNGPRKYLFLFQNNQEMRATGGFIGSYGLMDISEGRIRNFFIDGIFNPDGQLQEKIVPPKPIQKISAAWSLHDSNWWPDFPVSARKAVSFYEKTGGPTADGIIALTPTVMQKLLEITGPIEMEEYGVTIDSENFIKKTQYEVEIDYDKEENKPKKILSDLAPIILDKIFNARDAKSIAKTLSVLSEELSQKHILLFSQNKELQEIISKKGWSGEILDTQKDYLSVINSNINGYKTDGVIDEKIEHSAEIQDDGSVIDTVSITRHHNGGDFEYEWWNKVNADYMRVYVPLGSKLLEAAGQTVEKNNPPLDYEALGFRKDQSVEKEESGILIDEKSGTRIYDDSGKTVFANWTYVSPKETTVIRYKYLLPFKIIPNSQNTADSYSLLAQKQSGSVGSEFSSSIKFPRVYDVEWNYPENVERGVQDLKIDTRLDVDRFIGSVFTKNKVILND